MQWWEFQFFLVSWIIWISSSTRAGSQTDLHITFYSSAQCSPFWLMIHMCRPIPYWSEYKTAFISTRNRSEKVGSSYIWSLVFRAQLLFFASPFKCQCTFAAPGDAKNWFREEVVQCLLPVFKDGKTGWPFRNKWLKWVRSINNSGGAMMAILK